MNRMTAMIDRHALAYQSPQLDRASVTTADYFARPRKPGVSICTFHAAPRPTM